MLCECGLEPWKPVAGENLFRRESAAIAGRLHDRQSIEPRSLSLVGLQREVGLGRKSAPASIGLAREELGATPDGDKQRELLNARQRRLVSAEELRSLIAAQGRAVK